MDLRKTPKLILLFLSLILLTANAHAQCASGNEAYFIIANSFGCDSTTVEIINRSSLDLSKVSYFRWDFGNGAQVIGDSVTNTEFYLGAQGDDTIRYTYRSEGQFDIELTVVDDSSCRDSFEIKRAAINVVPNLEIEHSISYQEASFWLKNGPPSQVSRWIWNFGDPSAGTQNFNEQDFYVSHNYGPGAYMISLDVIIGNGTCRYTLFDTIQIAGPAAIIEVPSNRIAYSEKYQCTSNDTVHFTNNSIFYLNDSDPSDEDSIVTVNGESLLVFNYDTVTGIGDQTAIPPSYTGGRTDEHVVRIWDFGDSYAPQCTTSTSNNINVGMNCNYSTDQFPLHKYMEWDSIYHHHSYLLNDSFERTRWSDSLNTCYVEYVDTSMPVLHRKMYDWYKQKPYTARLWLKDTVTLMESSANISIVIGKPNAKKLTTDQENFCALNGFELDHYIEFDMNTGGQSYFAVNFDSVANPNGFLAYNSGGVLAPPAPGSPIPFVLPYDLTGNYPDRFIKGYTPGEIGQLNQRTPEGSFTLGLIVGNGPIPNGQSTPECMDTAWYHDMFRITPMDANFEVWNESGNVQSICVGETAYFKMNNYIQSDIEVLRWNWGYQGIGKGYNLDAYIEEFHYLEEYNGPVAGRNDSSISYSNQDWRYNYVIRTWLNDVDGVYKTDTIVIAIIKDWKTEMDVSSFWMHFEEDQIPYPDDLTPVDLVKMLGTCIDTTGLSDQIELTELEYRTYNGDQTYMVDNKRYRYTNSSKTDSIEVAHVLHFRDSSLQGYDTLIAGGDTVLGVWKKQYTYKDNGKMVNSNGPMIPSLSLLNTSGCDQRGAALLNIGFLNQFWLDQDEICNGLVINVEDSLRYWQVGDYWWPDDYPIDPRDLWHTPARYLNNIEVFEADWDSADGLNDWERSISLNHIYDKAGDYTITIHTKDSTGCHDTARLQVHVSELDPNFSIKDLSVGCEYSYEFADSSGISSRDELLRFEWDFGDGRTYVKKTESYTFPVAGLHDVTFTAWTKLGCEESISKQIDITDMSTLSSPSFSYSINDLSLTTFNQSDPNYQYLWLWDDGNSDTAYDATHYYGVPSDFDLCLRKIDTSTHCSSDSCLTVAVGDCNALFGYLKDTTATYTIVVVDSSTGSNLDYTWYWGDGDSSTTQRPSHDYNNFGRYLITLKVETNECISIYSDSLGMDSLGNLLKKDGFTIVVGKFSSIDPLLESELKVYPNPSSSKLHVSIEKGQLQNVAIYGIDGRKAESQVINKGARKWELDLSNLTGMYILQIETDLGRFVKRIEVIQ